MEKTQLLYKCEICDEQFKNKNGLKQHFNIVHNTEKEHQCNICQETFKVLSKLTRHVKIVHENKKDYKCNSCGKSFSQAADRNLLIMVEKISNVTHVESHFMEQNN